MRIVFHSQSILHEIMCYNDIKISYLQENGVIDKAYILVINAFISSDNYYIQLCYLNWNFYAYSLKTINE